VPSDYSQFLIPGALIISQKRIDEIKSKIIPNT